MTSQPDPGGEPSAVPGCAIEQLRTGDVAVVQITGTVDSLTAPDVDAAIRQAAQTAPRAVVVDLLAVDFLASAGMGLLIEAHGNLSPVPLVIVADGPATSRPLKLIGVTNLVDLFATVDEAVTAVTE